MDEAENGEEESGEQESSFVTTEVTLTVSLCSVCQICEACERETESGEEDAGLLTGCNQSLSGRSQGRETEGGDADVCCSPTARR